MTFLQLTFAVEVANSTSINKAAERLYTSQSNVSNSIKALEDELGIKIFDRTKKGITVTEPGREFLSYAREILDKMDFVEDLYKKSRFRQEYFSVSSMRSYFLSYPITRLWPEIEKGYNGHRIYVRLKKQSFNDVMDDVQYGHSDLGIVFLTRAHQQRVQRLNITNWARATSALSCGRNTPFTIPPTRRSASPTSRITPMLSPRSLRASAAFMTIPPPPSTIFSRSRPNA